MWPKAFAALRNDVIPNIPQSALEILPYANVLYSKYYCRAWIVGHSSTIQEQLTRK